MKRRVNPEPVKNALVELGKTFAKDATCIQSGVQRFLAKHNVDKPSFVAQFLTDNGVIKYNPKGTKTKPYIYYDGPIVTESVIAGLMTDFEIWYKERSINVSQEKTNKRKNELEEEMENNLSVIAKETKQPILDPENNTVNWRFVLKEIEYDIELLTKEIDSLSKVLAYVNTKIDKQV